MKLPPIFHDCGLLVAIDEKSPNQYRPLSNKEYAEVARRANSHEKLLEAFGLARSMILSGEKMTQQAENIFEQALKEAEKQ